MMMTTSISTHYSAKLQPRGGRLKDRKENWDELAINKNHNRKGKSKRSKSKKKLDQDEQQDSDFIDSLETSTGKYEWMKEKRYKSLFRDIENKLQGVMGKGSFEWVDRRVFDQVFDRLTLMSIFKLMKNKVIDTVDFPVARGKEAHVFHGTDPNGKPIAIKIFHTSNAVFKNLIQYIEGDRRFSGLRRRHRDLVDIWVRKEQRNLSRLAKWGLKVPEPLGIHKNVLVMDYLGNDTSPYPKLREVSVENPQDVYDELLEFLAVSWQKANLVHGDFSPFNILWSDEIGPIVIDVGQAVIQSHPKAQEFLIRDVTRLVEWGNKNGLEVELAEAMYEVLNMDLTHIVEQE